MIKSLLFLIIENAINMLMFLYRMASPRAFFYTTQSWLTPLGLAALFCLLMGGVWGLVFAPPDYQQGDAFRIIYVHVPAAFMSMALYSFMSFCAILVLVWRIKLAGVLLQSTAPIGACMALLALVTGSIWGRPMWGTWWIWDARLTSEFILLLFYAAILAVNHALAQRHARDSLLAILTLVGLIDLPVIHFSVYWWNTLHQGSTLSVFSKPTIALSMLYPLLLTLLGFLLFCIWSILYQAGTVLLMRERKQRWVRHVIEGE